MNLCTVKWTRCDITQSYSSKCADDCAQLQCTTPNSYNNLPSYFQTDTIAQMLAIGGEGVYFCIIIA